MNPLDDKTIFTLCFFKNKAITEYPWEQPNVPFLVYKKPNGSIKTFKILCDFKAHRVYLKVEKNNMYKIIPLQNFMSEVFGIPEIDIIGRYDDCLFDLIDDLKRNLHNRQGQLVKFEVEANQFGFSKINGAKRFETIES